MMSHKEWTAVVQIAGVIVVGAWLVIQALGEGFAGAVPLATVAMKLVWAIVAMVGFNVVGIILVTIFVSIARREEFKDEKADERDRAITALSSRNGYVVGSVAAAAALVAVAFGADPAIAVAALFVAPTLGGVTSAVSQLVYYRIG